MACMERGKRGLTVSVIILGGALLTVMLAFLVFGDTNDHEGLRTLRMVAILFRHGDRTPTEMYPSDPHLNHPWPGGLGALTGKGSLQMYNLGKNLHTRYYRLLPKDGMYSKEEIMVQSSYAERCLMSAQSFMAGFMPPLENRNPLPVPWQPIPIRSLPRTQDYLLAQKMPCKKYDEMLKNLYDNPPADVIEMMRKNEELFKMLTKNTGKNISSITDVEFLYNTLLVEQDAQLALPDWTEKVFPDKMLPMAKRSLQLFTETNFMKRIKGGIFVTEVIENMTKKRTNLLNPNRSLFVYSAHDVTLSNVMRAMGVVPETSAKPDYGAALGFELHHSVLYENDFEVKLVYYFNSEDKFPKDIPIPGCENPCSLTDFAKTYESLMVHNYEELCQVF